MDMFAPKVLSAAKEQSLKPLDEFQECTDCPIMVVVPAGTFQMGAQVDEAQQVDPSHYAENLKDHPDAYRDELPVHEVTFAHSFAVAKFDVTFDEWDTCYRLGGCKKYPTDENFGRGTRPVINVEWKDANEYVVWLSKRTGKTYRLLSEAEWEYSARAGSVTAFYWGNEVNPGMAVCDGCGSELDNKKTAPVKSFPSNAFKLFDMVGNVWQWVQDCYTSDYQGAPTDGSPVKVANCPQHDHHVLRGGSWYSYPMNSRSAMRAIGPQPPNPLANTLDKTVGFRVARTLAAAELGTRISGVHDLKSSGGTKSGKR
jgi:formylglycine-generating enzyme required for sulfatase activity